MKSNCEVKVAYVNVKFRRKFLLGNAWGKIVWVFVFCVMYSKFNWMK